MGTDDGIEYSRGYGDQCLTCHSRDIGYVSSEGRRFCKNCRRIAALESQLANAKSYPHMCRMDHIEIGHRDSSEERCPMCRMRDEYESQLDRYRWRRVEEEMPEERAIVLAQAFFFVEQVETIKAFQDEGEWFTVLGSRIAVTHWMPLPPAPEEGE